MSDAPKSTLSVFANNVRTLRVAQKLNQQKLADLTNVNVSYISRIENDDGAPPSFEFIQRLAQVLDIRAEWLVFRNLDEITSEEKTLDSLQAAVVKLSHAEQREMLGIVGNLLNGSYIDDITYKPGRRRYPRMATGENLVADNDPRIPERDILGVLSDVKGRQRVRRKRTRPIDPS